jgi:thiol-disulfide isomerase/thioredoxin
MATFVQHIPVTYESIMDKAATVPRFAVLCSTNWCRYCPSAVKLFEKLQNEQEDIELIVLKDMENTLFKQLSVTYYPTFIAFENGQLLYKGTSQIEFCNVFQIAHERKILKRPNGSDYMLGKDGEEVELSSTAARMLRSLHGEEETEETQSEPEPPEKTHTDSQGRQFKFSCDGAVCRKIYI